MDVHIEKGPWQFDSTATFTATAVFTNPPTTYADDIILALGTGSDQALVNRSTALNANTALTGVLVGTPITPAVAANSLIIGNITADGDILLAGQTGANSHAVFFADLSAGTTSIMVAGVAVARFDATDVLFPDDYILSLGTGTSVAYKSTSTLANTAVTSVILGTPIVPALAADTLIVANQIADGDILLAGQTGGNTQAVFFADLSAGTTSVMVAGVAVARFDATDVLFPDDYILSIGTGASVAYKDDATNANTAVTSVILGTPVVPALAADTLIVSNQIADGDLLFATQTGGNTQAAMWVDGSAGTIGLFSAGVRIAHVSAAAGVTLGLAGTTLGKLTLSGNTAGVITVNTAATAGDWTFTLPPDDGDAGEQLQTNGSGVSTWEAAGSLRAFKHVGNRVSAALGLQRILDTPIYDWRYKQPHESAVRLTTTGDFTNTYVGPMAEDAPWAMHHGKRIFDPVSAFGHAVLAIQALAAEIDTLKGARA